MDGAGCRGWSGRGGMGRPSVGGRVVRGASSSGLGCASLRLGPCPGLKGPFAVVVVVAQALSTTFLSRAHDVMRCDAMGPQGTDGWTGGRRERHRRQCLCCAVLYCSVLFCSVHRLCSALPRCAVRALHRDVLLRWLGACSSPDLPALAPVVVVGLGAPGPGGEWTLVAARLPRLDAGLAARRSRHRDRHRGSPRLSIKACPVRRPV